MSTAQDLDRVATLGQECGKTIEVFLDSAVGGMAVIDESDAHVAMLTGPGVQIQPHAVWRDGPQLRWAVTDRRR
ncbi:hypothetical protein LBMAG53_34920 [Planctomycetota bacterium]|nr:hypothetical protein LBMAG53_34920 [Planctomycetota bacterium]